MSQHVDTHRCFAPYAFGRMTRAKHSHHKHAARADHRNEIGMRMARRANRVSGSGFRSTEEPPRIGTDGTFHHNTPERFVIHTRGQHYGAVHLYQDLWGGWRQVKHERAGR